MNIDIYLTNSFGNKKEKFVPINKNKVGMYVCGPTVYDDPHIGNARPLVVFDILYKVLKCKYGVKSVSYVRNITDVDDKIIQSSLEKKISIEDLTKKITTNYHNDCDYLKCEKPNEEPKATENISLMVKMTEDLIKKNFAYVNNNHVYFEVKKFKDYGKLSNKNLEELIAGSRVEISENKKNPEDFVLWKPSKKNEPSWDSPWGKGRPGWHLECSVMSKKYLGTKFDIHGGGRDLIFPHHENEIAQSRCVNDSDVFANYWVHNGFITISNEKMAKSQGNILKINDFKKNINGQILRLALISAHYKQSLDWNEKLLDECQKILNKWYDCHVEVKRKVLIPENFLSPLYDDLNTPGYITNIHKLYDKAHNETKDKGIKPTPCIGGVGLLKNYKNMITMNLKKEGNLLLVIGKTEGHLDQSIFARDILSEKKGPPPEINLFNEKNNGLTILKLIEDKLVESCHDVSLGGILVAAVKMCIKSNKGIKLNNLKSLIDKFEYFFSEDQGRYIVEITKENFINVKKILENNSVHFDELGIVTINNIEFINDMKLSIEDLIKANKAWLRNYMIN